MSLNSNLPVEKLVGVGPKFAKKLKRLEIETYRDLLYHFPTRFEDYSRRASISRCQVGEPITITATVWHIKNNFTRRGFVKTSAILADNTGTIEAVWFNQSWVTNILKAGLTFQFSGKLKEFQDKAILINPDFEEPDKNLHTGRLTPIYPETDGVSSKWLRAKIYTILQAGIEEEEFLPPEILANEEFLPINAALAKIHFPQSFAEFEKAKKRLSFDEVFQLTLSVLSKKRQVKNMHAIPLKINNNLIADFAKSLPFKLTKGQEKAIGEVLQDLSQNHPAQRLIEGDVGSGKTVVVTAAILTACNNRTSAVMAAPTEILAFQHAENLKKMLEPFGIKVGLFTKSRKDKDAQVLVGTHALIKNDLSIKNLSLVVVDEQHKFGVSQRTELLKTNSKVPHLITMSATPIPRSLALTVFGDLDLTVISEMPPGRKPAKTYIVPPQKRETAGDFVKQEIKKGHQAFVVCPLIEESESLVSVKAAKVEFERLKNTVFNKIPIDLLHGRMKSVDKEKVLSKFATGETKILVSTAVVEVGIDIPAATVMIIEGTDRFGLAQLHQLRGRVGRAQDLSYCFLFSDNLSKNVRARLQALVRNSDGAKLAEIDLSLRGPGEFFGTAQHGFTRLKLAKLTDLQLIASARNWANKILEEDPTFSKFPKLAEIIKTSTSEEVTLS